MSTGRAREGGPDTDRRCHLPRLHADSGGASQGLPDARSARRPQVTVTWARALLRAERPGARPRREQLLSSQRWGKRTPTFPGFTSERRASLEGENAGIPCLSCAPTGGDGPCRRGRSTRLWRQEGPAGDPEPRAQAPSTRPLPVGAASHWRGARPPHKEGKMPRTQNAVLGSGSRASARGCACSKGAGLAREGHSASPGTAATSAGAPPGFTATRLRGSLRPCVLGVSVKGLLSGSSALCKESRSFCIFSCIISYDTLLSACVYARPYMSTFLFQLEIFL